MNIAVAVFVHMNVYSRTTLDIWTAHVPVMNLHLQTLECFLGAEFIHQTYSIRTLSVLPTSSLYHWSSHLHCSISVFIQV